MATRAPVRLPQWAEQLLGLVHVDWEPSTRQPSTRRVVLACVLSIAGSLVADTALVALGTYVFPSTRGFVHFRFSDYASLTVVGVALACAGWPVVTHITSMPRWLFFRLAIAVTLVLFLPDAWILLSGEPIQAVAVLMLMHLAIALVTYNLLVYVAPAGRRRRAAGSLASLPLSPVPEPSFPSPARVPVVAVRDGAVLTAVRPPAVHPHRQTFDRPPASVARPPATLAEPMSAVRVLPPRPRLSAARGNDLPSGPIGSGVPEGQRHRGPRRS